MFKSKMWRSPFRPSLPAIVLCWSVLVQYSRKKAILVRFFQQICFYMDLIWFFCANVVLGSAARGGGATVWGRKWIENEAVLQSGFSITQFPHLRRQNYELWKSFVWVFEETNSENRSQVNRNVVIGLKCRNSIENCANDWLPPAMFSGDSLFSSFLFSQCRDV